MKLSLPLSLFMLATAPIIVKLSQIHALTLLCWRLTLVSLLLFPFILLKRSGTPSKEILAKISLVSFFLVIHFYTWFKGVPQMPVAVATIIYATNPIYTALLGYFLLKEPYHPRYALGLGLCLIGIYLAIRHKLSDQVIATEGLIYMFMTAFFYSCYMTLAKKMRLNLPNTQFNFFLNLIAALIAFSLLTIVNLSAEQNIAWIGFPASQWGVILALAIFPSLLGHTLMIYAIKEYNLNFVSIFKLLNPLIGAVLAYFIFDESISMGFWAGFVFVLSGVLLSLR